MEKVWREGNNYLIRLLCAKLDVGSVNVIVTYSTHCSRRRWCTGNPFCIVRACIGLLVTIIIRLADDEVGADGVLRYQAGATKSEKWRTQACHYGTVPPHSYPYSICQRSICFIVV